MSAEGMAEWHGSGVGRPVGPGTWKYSYGDVYTTATPEKRHRLLNVYTVGNMKMTPPEIFIGESGNGNSDVI